MSREESKLNLKLNSSRNLLISEAECLGKLQT